MIISVPNSGAFQGNKEAWEFRGLDDTFSLSRADGGASNILLLGEWG